MIPSRLRISRRDFESVASATSLKRAQSPHFSISYGPSPLGRGGCAAVVPKKVEKSSVKRHILKRRILTIARPHIQSDGVLVVYTKAGSTTLSHAEMLLELSELISRTSQ